MAKRSDRNLLVGLDIGTSKVVAIVGEAAQGRAVSRVTLEVGKLSGVMAGASVAPVDWLAAFGQGTR